MGPGAVARPSGNVLATTNSASAGAIVSLNNIALPADGTYTVDVRAAASDTAATGNYVVAAWNVTLNVQALNLNQQETSTLVTPYSVDEWNFSAAVGTQVQFELAKGSVSGLVYSLTGPNGFAGFINAAGSSDLIDLPESGAYTLTADATGGATGNYGFTMAETSVTPFQLGTPATGTFAGSGQAQLYTVQMPTTGPMSMALSDLAVGDQTELYARLGAAPTRETYDYGTNGTGANQSLLIPSADAGTWYILVYAETVASAPSSFTLQASSGEVLLTHATPTEGAANAATTMTISGAGFNSGSSVSLVAGNGKAYAATSSSTDLPTQITATFAAGTVPAGTYSVEVTQSDGATAELPSAFSMSAAPGWPDLVTNLILPSWIG